MTLTGTREISRGLFVSHGRETVRQWDVEVELLWRRDTIAIAKETG
jgi:hypothetical protein